MDSTNDHCPWTCSFGNIPSLLELEGHDLSIFSSMPLIVEPSQSRIGTVGIIWNPSVVDLKVVNSLLGIGLNTSINLGAW